MGRSHEAGKPIQAGDLVIVPFCVRRGFTTVDPHSDANWPGLRPYLGMEGALRGDGGQDAVERSGKGCLDHVADVLEEDTMVRNNGFGQQFVVPFCGARHDWPIALPEASTAFNVGEEKSDVARGEVARG